MFDSRRLGCNTSNIVRFRPTKEITLPSKDAGPKQKLLNLAVLPVLEWRNLRGAPGKRQQIKKPYALSIASE